jgi:hypothetical protein
MAINGKLAKPVMPAVSTLSFRCADAAGSKTKQCAAADAKCRALARLLAAASASRRCRA